MFSSRLLPVLLCGVTIALTGACGDDGPSGPRSSFEPEPEQGLAMSPAIRGLHAYPSDSFGGLHEKFAADSLVSDNVVFYEQVYSEFHHAQVGGQPRQAPPRYHERVAAFYADPDFADTLTGGFERTWWVLDLQRLDREWLVDWNGLERDEPDLRATSLSFTIRATDHDSDYQEAVIASVVASFEDSGVVPTSLIVGSEMDRYYADNEGDWPAAVAFVRDLREAVRAVAPGVRVGVGINWSSFMDEVVPRFVGAAGEDEVNFAVVRAAWEAVIDPFYATVDPETGEVIGTVLDFYAFASIPDTTRYASPESIPDSHYAGIRTMFDESPERALPVAWFSVGWPVTNQSSAFWEGFLDRFLALNGGYTVELVSWWGYSQLSRDRDCGAMTGRVGVSIEICSRGLYSVSGSRSPGLHDRFFADGDP